MYVSKNKKLITFLKYYFIDSNLWKYQQEAAAGAFTSASR